MIILGIDPGFAIMGWGVIESDGRKHTMKGFGALTTPARTPAPIRLRSLFGGVDELIGIYKPDAIVFEELFFNKNVSTAMLVSAARGVALVAAARRSEELFEYTPLQIKQALTGYGRADKQQMQAMVRLLLSLKETPQPDDAADALAVAITHAHSMRSSEEFRIK